MRRYRTGLKWLAVGLITLGICLRLSNLGLKVYWHDEVFTSLRVAGYLGREVEEAVFTGVVFPAKTLLQYQQFPEDGTLAKTWRSLTDHPEHPPAYYLMAYGWGRLWGASVAGYRAIAAFFGILALPLVFGLSRELFPQPKTTAWLATALFALSPIQLIYSQEAREYSLWTFSMLLATLALLYAVRQKQSRAWVVYSLGLAFSLYSSLVTVLLGLSHLVFMLVTQKPRQWLNFVLASGAAVVLFTPWLWVIWQNWQRLQTVTAWTKQSRPVVFLAKLWGLHYSATVVDFNLPLDHPFTFVVPPLAIAAILGTAIGLRCWGLGNSTTLLLIMVLVPPLLIIGHDVLRSGQISGTTRYFLPSLVVVPILFGAWLSGWIESQHPWRRWAAYLGLGALLVLGALSCLTNLQASTWWNKGSSYYNPPIAQAINQSPALPVVIVFSGDTSLGDAISLSYYLSPQITMQLLPQSSLEKGAALWDELMTWSGPKFLYKPSRSVLETLPPEIIGIPTSIAEEDSPNHLVELRLKSLSIDPEP